MNNMVIGGTTAVAGSFTDLSVTGTTSFDGSQGTAGQVLTSAGTGATPTWTTPTTGTVTSVTGTAPVVSSGGNTPAISMAAATGSVNGYLTSTDWTTFNNKTSNTGTVTSVAATVPSFLSVSGSPITTSGTLALTYSGTALPVANGGTGVTTSTGSVDNVLSTSPTITTPIITTTLGVGGSTPSASGAGITFPATQSASTDANTLDDYEEGTWTPAVTALVGSITTVTSAGQYRKIGSLVVAQFQYGITNNGTGSVAIVINGLPFSGTASTSGGLAREIAVTGVSGGAYLSAATTMIIVTAAGLYMGATGWQVVGTISYQTT
jgi:hypothetical protein